MGRMMTCNNCGHGQLIGENPVDGRIKWWTTCNKCKKGNFIARPPEREIKAIAHALRRVSEGTDG